MTVDASWRRRVSIRQLQLVSVLSQELSLSRCAEVLHTTQPACSRALSALEDQIGQRLFERTTKHVRPTTAGLRLMKHANRVLAEIDAAQESIEGLNEKAGGEMRIGIAPTFSPAGIGTAISRFRALAPDVSLRTYALPAQALHEELVMGRIALMFSHLHAHIDFDRVQMQPLYEENAVVLANARHRFAGTANLTWNELADESWIVPPTDSPMRRKLGALLAEHRKEIHRQRDVQTDSVWIALSIVRTSPTLWATTSRLAQTFLQTGDVVQLSIPTHLPVGSMCCLWRRSHPLGVTLQLFKSCVQDAVGDRSA